MSGSVGSVNFYSVRAGVREPAETTELLNRANVDGLTIRKTGKRGLPFLLQCTRDVTQAELQGLSSTLAALQSTFQTVTLDNGTTFPKAFVMFVDPLDPEPVSNAQGGLLPDGAADYILKVRMDCILPG